MIRHALGQLLRYSLLGFALGELLLLNSAALHSALAGATPKLLSTNFTLVNLENGANRGAIHYYLGDGSVWRDPEPFTFSACGDQLIQRQYDPTAGFPPGRGSSVISATGSLGAVVQIRAVGDQTPTSGAYAGAASAAATAYLPLVLRQVQGASGVSNSQIIVQNAGADLTAVEIELIGADGATQFKKSTGALAAGAAYTYDLAAESASNVPVGWYGSALLRTTTGVITAISNLFIGEHGLQTFNAFTRKGQLWLAPLFTSRLDNGLSTPLAIQNLSGGTIPVDGIVVSCQKDPNSVGDDFVLKNQTAVGNTASYFFNPVVDQSLPTAWFGACRIETTGFDTVAFVQLRTIGTDLTAAYEALAGDSTDREVVIPLFAKRLCCGFATVTTVQNLSTVAPAQVTLTYKGAEGLPANCSLTQQTEIAPGASLIHNLRLDQSGPGAVPELGNQCYGSLVVTSADQPIGAVVQLTDINPIPGDTLMAHLAFPANRCTSGRRQQPSPLTTQTLHLAYLDD